ncbi:DUF6702 family protein [Idiomarina sp.]|uniref:DUF6702 family protein n=1 Tax=Idiomarina sp. TaxID=1874361 RepID=UPI002EC1C5CD|nr:DUF6702 family protein [Pseudomonadota bacterium]
MIKTLKSNISRSIIGLIASCALLPPVAAHKYFFGLTDVSWNAHTGNIEVVHQYTLHDVELAIGRFYDEPFRIDQPDADQRVKEWIRARFVMKDTSGRALNLDWVGLEADFQNLWIYQEKSHTKTDFCDWKITNRVMLSTYPAQVNTVNVKSDELTRGVTLNEQRDTKEINCGE